MDNPDATADAPQTPSVAQQAAETVSQDAVNADTFHLDLEAGPILAEILSSEPVADVAVDDLHAAVAALPAEGFDHVDAALQHLTHAVDLFDVPADLGGGDSADGA
jgi:hypothetical protein